MEVKVLEETKNKIVFELKGEGEAFCNALKDELWRDKHVKTAGYHIEHPLEGIPKIIVETDGKEKPRAALLASITRLKKTNEKFSKEFTKSVR
ncbi:DNA-directed RNA polymerase subunit L [Candidatus Woesearchaeota archaeon]|nr:MAG: DNA-directed RNA polymerase subunit L [Candidatus Woesearchaeota archaeon]